MIICDKSFCNYCEKIFDFKNKLYNHIRNKEYQQSLIKNKSVNKINLTSLFILKKNVINDKNTVKEKIIHFITTSFFAAKSISFHKFNLLILASIESFLSSTSLSIYRFVLFSSFIYEPYKKSYLTIVDLYIRYVLLSKPLCNKVTRIIIMLFIMFMQNLYEKFRNKKKRVILTSNKTR